MKKFQIAVLILFAVTLVSCDKVSSPYMEVQDNIIPDTAECPVPEFPADNQHQKTVLLEDYTGHTCVNCPEAAAIAAGLQQNYGEQLIVLAVHSGYFAEPEGGNYSLDLRCSVGEEIHNYYGITNNPAGIFNRKQVGGSLIHESAGSWNARVTTLLAEAPVADMQIITQYNDSTRKLCCHVRTEFLQAYSGDVKLSLYIAEDSIKGYQKNNKTMYGTVPDIADYTFMHVLRGAVNGSWGDLLFQGGATQGAVMIKSYKTVLNQDWNAKHCKIIAFISDASTREILHVIEVHAGE